MIITTKSPSKHHEIGFVFSELIGLKGVEIYIHGSRSDGKFTRFSDLDDLIIFDPSLEGFEPEKFRDALKAVEKRFYRMDPLQHHGHFLVEKSQLKNFGGHPLPIQSLSHITCLTGAEQIDLEIDTDQCDIYARISLMETIKGVSENYRLILGDGITLYNLKCFVSGLALIPCLHSQVQGHAASKELAIQTVSGSPGRDGECIRWTTEIREKWGHLFTARLRFYKALVLCSPYSWGRRLVKRARPFVGVNQLLESFPKEHIIPYLEMIVQNECLGFQTKTQADYSEGVSKVRRFLEVDFASSKLGTFGDISFPGISDLDIVVIVENDDEIQWAQKELARVVSQDRNLHYLMEPHGVLVVSQNSLPFLKKLHSVYGLSFEDEVLELSAEAPKDNGRKEVIEIVWSIFILQQLLELLINPLKLSPRTKFLLGKNAAQSVDNLDANSDKTGKVFEMAKLRSEFLKNPSGFDLKKLDMFLLTCASLIKHGLVCYSKKEGIIPRKIPCYGNDGSVWRDSKDENMYARRSAGGVREIYVCAEILGLVEQASGRANDTSKKWEDYHHDLREASSFFERQNSHLPFITPPAFVGVIPLGAASIVAKDLVRKTRFQKRCSGWTKLVTVG